MDSSTDGIALIKFLPKQEYRQSLLSGKIHTKTFQYYRELDKPDVGDVSESCFRYYDKSRGDSFPDIICFNEEGDVIELPLNLENAVSLLIYPSNEPDDGWLDCWSLIGPHNGLEDSIEKLAKKFGPYFVIMPCSTINKYAKRIEKKCGVKVKHGLVKYKDDPNEFGVGIKTSQLAYQREYRFVIGSCLKGANLVREFEVGKLGDLVSAPGTIKFAKPDGSVIYHSVGNTCRVEQ